MAAPSYVPILLSSLRGDQKINFDIFIKLQTKHILYLRRGNAFDASRLERLKDKKLSELFISAEDASNYRKYMNRNVEMAYDKTTPLNIETRIAIIEGSHQAFADILLNDTSNNIVYGDAKDYAEKFPQFLLREPTALTQLMNTPNTEKNLAVHAFTVSALSVALAHRLGISDPKQLQMLALGSLLHDMGHVGSPINPAQPMKLMKPEDLGIYKQHPIEGGKRAQETKHFDQIVLNIIAQHEEYIDGKGFPNGLNESKLDPLAIITATANTYDRFVTYENVPKTDAIKKMTIDCLGRYPLKHIQQLSDICKTMKI